MESLAFFVEERLTAAKTMKHLFRHTSQPFERPFLRLRGGLLNIVQQTSILPLAQHAAGERQEANPRC